MKLIRKRGSTSNIIRIFLPDSSSTTGAGKTALDHTAAGLNISVIADNESSATTYTSAGSTIEAVTTIGTYSAPTATKCRFKKIDDTNLPGIYEIQLADARFAVSSSKSIQGMITATGVVPTPFEIDLEPGTVQDSIVTAVDNVDNFVDTEISTIISELASATYGLSALKTLIDTLDNFVDTEVQTLLDRLGSFTGSGVNTDLGVLQAICRNNTTLPSDIGGTYAVASHSLQALASAIDTIDNFIDTEIAAIIATLGTPDGASISEDIFNIISYDIPTRFDTVDASLTVIDNFVDTEIATILNRLGAWTGTSTNTILGALRSITNSNLSAPTDLTTSGDYAADENALHALRSRIDEAMTSIENIESQVYLAGYPYTLHQLMRIKAAAVAGKTSSPSAGVENFYDISDGITLAYQVTISAGHRAVTAYFP
jgi:hypothetical protein